MTVQARAKLDRYERGICEHLVNQCGYDRRAARLLVLAFLPVLKLQDRYDSCRMWAERLDEAKRNGLTPEEWLKRIRKIRGGAERAEIFVNGKEPRKIVAAK
ncbi:MAG TPA: hypothetical protein VF260_06605 [Bacilli bacterium]